MSDVGEQMPRSSGIGSLFVISILIVGHYDRDEVFGKTVSLVFLTFSMWSFYPFCAGGVQLVIRFSSEGISVCVAVDLVYVWEAVCSGSSYAALLNLPLSTQ